jgi:glycosyltransferase involved in cell wall biosynthesis
MKDITVIIPSKSEPYLKQTILDIDEHAETDLDIVFMDGGGQREQMNHMARNATSKYIMKVDAHCSFGPGFDRIMLEDMQDNWILAPYLLPLDAENWKVRFDKRMAGYVFDTQLVMQHAENNDELLQETMCLQGSCFLVSKENYFKWNLCDESLGSWGGQGVELGIKAFLNGGKCVTTKKTYYGHLFRTNEEDFPYKRHQAEIDKGHQVVLEKLKTKAIAPLIEKYNYPCDWTPDFVKALT